MDKIAVPLLENRGLESRLSGHFGRAPFIGVVSIDNQSIREVHIVANTGEHFGGRGKAAVNILKHDPTVVVVLSCGPGAIQNFQQRNIAVLTGQIATLQDAVDGVLKDTLQELTEGCKGHRH